ncbi:kinesin-like protein KIF14 [Protopterus annectens]|uniref:kinesin-like protein KIF14 n=1 Tax=Protopterus annectens TaxID=7888 RepID=UPI001CF988B3|nr:kinesin-like protein KIF14 [Protopterus annectens]
MPIYTTPSRNDAAIFSSIHLSKKHALTDSVKYSNSSIGQQTNSQPHDKNTQQSSALSKSRKINTTYVLSACKNSTVGVFATPKSDTTLRLQRRKTSSREPADNQDVVTNDTEYDSEKEQQTEKKLTLQRRTRTRLLNAYSDKNNTPIHGEPSVSQQDVQVTPLSASSVMSSKVPKDAGLHTTPKSNNLFGCKDSQPLLNYNPGIVSESTVMMPTSSSGSTPVSRWTPGMKLNGKQKVGHLTEKTMVKTPYSKSHGLERSCTPKSLVTEGIKPSSKFSNPQICNNIMKNIWQRPKMSTANTSCFGGEKKVQVNETLHLVCPLHEKTDCTDLVHDHLKIENSAVTVAVRVRPFNSREKSENAVQVVFVEGQETIVYHPETSQQYNFVYDYSFSSFDETSSDFASQADVYKTLAAPLLDKAFEGYNTCLFAYGQTASGKSYTMMGFSTNNGIIPRFCEQLFSRIAKSETREVTYHLEMSYLEIYNEKIHDLLVVKDENGQKKQALKVREHPIHGPYVEDLSTNVVSSFLDVQSWLELGNKQRATAATGMNDRSSRSHSVLSLVMTQIKTQLVEEEEHEHRIISRINLVDLAGSERCGATETTGERLKEGVSINKSLFTLGKVISALSEYSETRKNMFIPYRESILTWLLKESLGGNSKTAMIATVSPAGSSVEETLSTLRYARQARKIINTAKVNEDTNSKIIRELKAEIEKLKTAQMSSQGIDMETFMLCQQEIKTLRKKLSQMEKDMIEAQRIWKEKLEQAEKRKSEETKELQKVGISFKVDNKLPSLVNITEDPQLSETLLYVIKVGQTKVGKLAPTSTHDIQLSGALIAEDHCVITHEHGTVNISPAGTAKTYVNGQLILASTVLRHGDRVILGGDHYFRFNHPVEVQQVKKYTHESVLSSDVRKDYEYAKSELLAGQRAQLEAEIKEAQVQAKKEMMQGIQLAQQMAEKELSHLKAYYENKMKDLQLQLETESQKKGALEFCNQEAASKIEELHKIKEQLEQQVHLNEKRLKMETMATRQALEDHNLRHTKIIEALESEKCKIADEVAKLQQARYQKTKDLHCASSCTLPNWNSMKLSMMIQEANTISHKLRKDIVFNRHEASDKGNSDTSVRVRNTKLGISTFWSLEKFECKLAEMRELYETHAGNKDDDIFYDPNDEWEPDISSASAAASFSRRRSRSLMKNRRISGCLYEIRVHPIQSLQFSNHSGLLNASKPLCTNVSEPILPTVCKDHISSALTYLGKSHLLQENVADRIIKDLITVRSAVNNIAHAYNHQDEECQENLFSSDRSVQFECVRLTSAVERMVVLTKQWLDSIPQCTDVRKTDEALKDDMKKLGGYLQLLLQGCCSDISSLVTEAHDKTNQVLEQTLRHIGFLVVLAGTELHLTEETGCKERNFSSAFYDGLGNGLKTILASGFKRAKMIQEDIPTVDSECEVLHLGKNTVEAFSICIQNFLNEYYKKDVKAIFQAKDEEEKEYSFPDLKIIHVLCVDAFKMTESIAQFSDIAVCALKGSSGNISQLRGCVDAICCIARRLNDGFNSFPSTFQPTTGSTQTNICNSGAEGSKTDLAKLDAVAKSVCSFLSQLLGGVKDTPEDSLNNSGHHLMHNRKLHETDSSGLSSRNRIVPKHIYKFVSET